MASTDPKIIDRSFSVGDPLHPENVIRPNSDGSVNTVAQVARQSAGASEFGVVVTNAAVVHLNPPAGATSAQISVNTAAVRYRDDGLDPTTTEGHPLAAGSSFLYFGPLSVVGFIAQAGNATLDVSYYK